MAFIFNCPFCNSKLDCDDSLNGSSIQCPWCGKDIVPTVGALETSIPLQPPIVEPPPSPKSEQPPPRNQNLPPSGNGGGSSYNPYLFATDTKGNFKRGIVADILFWNGVLCLALTVLIAIALLIDLVVNLSSSATPYFISAFIGSLSLGMVYIGLGQIIHSIRRTDYNSERMVSLLRQLLDEQSIKHK